MSGSTLAPVQTVPLAITSVITLNVNSTPAAPGPATVVAQPTSFKPRVKAMAKRITEKEVVEDRRDPQLRLFEDYLLKNLKASDVVTDQEGFYLFNVNQVAYLVEESSTKVEQKSTVRRVNNGLPGIHHEMKRVPPSNRGELPITQIHPGICLQFIPKNRS